MPIELSERNGRVHFALKVVPGASRDKVMGELGPALKVAVSKPPEGGAANRAVVELLAGVLGVPKSSIEIVRGQTNARKEIAIAGLNLDQARDRLQSVL